MKTRAQINFNYRQAISQASNLENIAARLDNVSKRDLERSVRNLANGWKGANAASFINKEETLQSKITGTARSVRDVASDIRRVAKMIYDAEMAALQIAETRKS